MLIRSDPSRGVPKTVDGDAPLPPWRAPRAPRWLAEPPAPPPSARPESFGAWLFMQRDRGDAVDRLAAMARDDENFLCFGTPAEVRSWLRGCGLKGEAGCLLDEAERCWRSL